MRLAKMDRRVTIQRVTLVDDGYSSTEQWADLFRCWAEVRQVGGQEFLQAMAIGAEKRVVFYIRWYAGLLATDRVMYEGKPHNIAEVREIGRRDGVELHTVAEG